MTDPLPFTGERFTPECVREIWYEHWHRYAFALPLARGRRVLDAACGEGYGSALLATTAASVLGADLADAAVAHARARYGAIANLRFARADVTALDELPDASFDLIVSFETLEHVPEHERMLAGFARLLADGGLLLISSPDKRTYSDLSGHRNEHHVRELYRDELEALLARHFPARRLYGQKLLFQSAIWSLDTPPERFAAATVSSDQTNASSVEAPRASAGLPPGPRVEPGLGYAPLYFIALCARSAEHLPADTAALASWFGDAAESVYQHYNDEVRKHIAAGTRLIELERRFADLERRGGDATSTLDRSAPSRHPGESRDPAASATPPAGEGALARLRRWLGR